MQDCWQFNFYKGKFTREPFGQRVLKLPDDFKYDTEKICTFTTIPFWHYISPLVSTDLSNFISKCDNVEFQKQASLELIYQKWKNYLQIFTDGSKCQDTGSAAAAVFVPYYDYIESNRLQNNTSSYRSELAAIVLALDWLNQIPNLYTDAVIFCDSLSALEAIKSQKEEQFIHEILLLYTQLHFKGTEVHL